MAICFFIGHRDTPDTVLPALAAEVERHIREYGVVDFVAGHYGRFDALAAKAVMDAKKRHPMVTLTLLLPYHPAERAVDLPPGFDGTLYPPGMETAPKRLAILRSNHYMVEHSTHLIAYVTHPSAGSREVLEEALRRQKRGLMRVTNLADEWKGERRWTEKWSLKSATPRRSMTR